MPLSFESIFLLHVAIFGSSRFFLKPCSSLRNLAMIRCFEEMRGWCYGCCSIATHVPSQYITQRGQASAVVNSLQWRKQKGVIVEESKKKSSKLKYRNRFVV